jgi:hypothetical protein
MPLSLQDLSANQDVVARLYDLSEFEPVEADGQPSLLSPEDVGDFTLIGRDGSGGEFVQQRSTGRMVLFSSEGEAGVVAGDLDAFIGLIVAMPYWRDVLHFSGNGKLEDMRRAAEVLEKDWAEDAEAVASRAFLRKHFGLGEAADVVADLHAAVSSETALRDLWGMEAASLFRSFTVEQWRP